MYLHEIEIRVHRKTLVYIRTFFIAIFILSYGQLRDLYVESMMKTIQKHGETIQKYGDTMHMCARRYTFMQHLLMLVNEVHKVHHK